ncbi:putative membrane protein [Thermosporothrix hazakensis]|uniref:ECF transporter S component n=2 Tax=Thermosporothrix TaxID=768650 RepID=A0A455SMA2_9CHLR|nr:ECF transporter S component [Thermosporothrix hazakensis]PZW36382.1 putative membrane protein [Thermosporothrix hazakensis]BBH88846.1 hypothetical protein KTC_35970 [Thermosporothrix sp. COM3]GCE47031.1 hypothetical protein KTH_19000 [Thermosporothrix hazakensis]
MKEKGNRDITREPAIWSITTDRIVIAGILAAITICITLIPGIGFIPIPNITGNATIAHIPTVIGGIIGGPVVGFFSGLIFGIMSLLHATIPMFKDPLVSILPRIFIGLVAWGVFAALKRLNTDLAAIMAGFLGSATNTVLVLGMGLLRGYVPLALLPTVLPQAIAEAIISALLAEVIVRSYSIVQRRLVHAPETKNRDELPY